jgi:hypothetical protein
MHPIPPGIFGYRADKAGINPNVYDWVDGKPRRKPVEEARRLLAEAGYPGGRDARTGEPLVVNLDTTGSGMGDKSTVDWLNKQFRKLDAAGGACDRLQPLPGQDPQGQCAAFLLGLERRLPGPGELPVPALWCPEARSRVRARMRPTTRTPNTTVFSSA